MLARLLVLITILATPAFAADELIRRAEPRSCFLFSWGKGPNWKTGVPIEFHRHYLNLKQPYVDDRYFDPTPDALTWIDRTVAPTISQIARVDGRIVLRVDYPIDGKFGRDIECVMLAMETAPKSGWFAPFFVAQPELFSGLFVSSDSIRIGYVASLEFSGTGAMRTHHLFDLTGSHPVAVGAASAGRVRSIDFDTDEEYKEALKMFDLEAKLLNGEQVGADQPAAALESKPQGKEKPKPESEARTQ
ncbi:hypothetical protein [Rubritalea sp.]|uniref:hypothetical protein n=1 Tax=Rubritalea sp. TaxID=2109375 RepID=UPI003EFA05C4